MFISCIGIYKHWNSYIYIEYLFETIIILFNHLLIETKIKDISKYVLKGIISYNEVKI